MKKSVSTAIFISVGTLFAVSSARAEVPLDYAGAGIAIQSVDIEGVDAGMALVLNGGKAMPDVYPNFSIEGEFTYTLSSASSDETFLGSSWSTEISVMTLAGYGVYSHEISPELTVQGRAGLLYESIDMEVSGSWLGSASASDSDIGLSLGVGAAYQVNEQISLTVDWTLIESDVSHLGAGVSYKS